MPEIHNPRFVPVVLEGKYVRLEPLTLAHADALTAVGCDPEIWRWMPLQARGREDMVKIIEGALVEQAAGRQLPFATIERSGGKAVGSTRFMDIQPAHRGVEIGYTWIAPPWQRSAVNTEAKLLMLRHAFETWKCLRVALKTDVLNQKSRNAIERLGAKPEGIFRKHMLMEGGRVRDSAWYSITNDEWPEVERGLRARLQQS